MVSTKPSIDLVIRTHDDEFATSIVCAWFHLEPKNALRPGYVLGSEQVLHRGNVLSP